MPETGKFVCDVAYDGQEVLLLKGGRGGLGNFQFRTSTNQAPSLCTAGRTYAGDDHHHGAQAPCRCRSGRFP